MTQKEFNIENESKEMDSFLERDFSSDRTLICLKDISDKDDFKNVNICLFKIECLLEEEKTINSSDYIIADYEKKEKTIKCCFVKYASKIIESMYRFPYFSMNAENGTISVVYDTPYKSDLDQVIDLFSKLNSLSTLINLKCWKKSWPKMKFKAALDYGEVTFVRLDSGNLSMDGKVISNMNELLRYSENSLVIRKFMLGNLKEYNQGCFSAVKKENPGDLYETKKYDVSMNNFITR